MLNPLWAWPNQDTHITPSSLVVRGSLAAAPNAGTRAEGVSRLTLSEGIPSGYLLSRWACLLLVLDNTNTFPANQAGGQNNKSLRGIPLVSPGPHNPVRRNGQQRRIGPRCFG